MTEAEVARRILDQDSPPQGVLNLIDMTTYDCDGLLRVREREEVVQIGAPGPTPAEVLRDQVGLETADERSQATQVARIEPVGTPQRNADRVERHRVVVPNPLKSADRGSAAHVVFGMDLEPGNVGTSDDDLGHMRGAKADPDSGRPDRLATIRRGHATRPRRHA